MGLGAEGKARRALVVPVAAAIGRSCVGVNVRMASQVGGTRKSFT